MCWPEKKHLEHRRTASTGKNHLRTTAADSSRPQVVKAGSKRDPLEEWPPLRGSATSASGDASSDKEQSRAASAPLSTAALRKLQRLCVYINTALPDVAHYMEILTYAEYAYAAGSEPRGAPPHTVRKAERCRRLPTYCG